MRLYEPKIEIRLVKAFTRKEIVTEVPVAARYGDLKAMDLTDWLGESGMVRTSKSVREAAGGFTITLPDEAYIWPQETIYALVEPMDLVEIRFCHDPFEYAKPDEGYRPPVVMRGLVSTVTRNEVMSGGRPQRTVTISGQDFGKILQIIQIFYLNNSVVGDNILSELAFFQKYAGENSAKVKTAKEFVADVLNGVINKYLKRFSSLSDGESVGAKVINEWSSKVTVDGVVSPYSVASFNNTSLYQMLHTLLDVGPFNEMYVEDLQDGVQLTVRPAPFLDVKGNLIQGEFPEYAVIQDTDVVSLSVNRTDAGVANYYWVSNSRWTMMSNEDSRRLASVGEEGSFILFDYLNCKSAYYGIRKMEVESTLGPQDYANYEAQTKAQQPVQTNSLADWLTKRRKLLADINKDNVVFENGSIRIRGNERIKAGMLIYILRNKSVVSMYYVTRVDHEFSPYQGFYTNLTVERGTSFIGRSQSLLPDYFPEINARGVV